MKSILVVSHGKMAEGMVDTAKFIMGDSVEKLDCLCLKHGESAEGFGTRLEKKLKEINDGDGVIILADLFGGTPCNQSIIKAGQDVEIISGVNLPLLLDVLMKRLGCDGIDIDSVVFEGGAAVQNVKKLAAAKTFADGDE